MPIIPLPKTLSFAEEYEPVYDILDVTSVTVQDDLGFWGVPSDIFGLAMEDLSYIAAFDDARDIPEPDIDAEAGASATAAEGDLSSAREAWPAALLSPLDGCSPLRSLDICSSEQGSSRTRTSPEALPAAHVYCRDKASWKAHLFGQETTKNRRAAAQRAEPIYTSTPTPKTCNTHQKRKPASREPLFPSHPRTPPSVTFVPSEICDGTVATPSMTEDELDETDDEPEDPFLSTPPPSTRATALRAAAAAAPATLGLALDVGPPPAPAPAGIPLAALPLAGLRVPFADAPAARTRPWLARKAAFREGGPSWRRPSRGVPQNTASAAETCQH